MKLGTGSTFFCGNLALYHGKEKKLNKKVRFIAGVAIILTPVLVSVWKREGRIPAMTSSVDSNFQEE